MAVGCKGLRAGGRSDNRDAVRSSCGRGTFCKPLQRGRARAMGFQGLPSADRGGGGPSFAGWTDLVVVPRTHSYYARWRHFESVMMSSCPKGCPKGRPKGCPEGSPVVSRGAHTCRQFGRHDRERYAACCGWSHRAFRALATPSRVRAHVLTWIGNLRQWPTATHPTDVFTVRPQVNSIRQKYAGFRLVYAASTAWQLFCFAAALASSFERQTPNILC